jgi:hypothetical protein
MRSSSPVGALTLTCALACFGCGGDEAIKSKAIEQTSAKMKRYREAAAQAKASRKGRTPRPITKSR